MDEIVDVRTLVEAVSSGHNAPLYQDEGLCMRCHQNGNVTILLTVIPNFKQILLSYFECPHCGERNNEVNFAGELQPKACSYTLDVAPNDQKLLNRQVVKSDSATIKIPELDFEIPPEAQRGSLSTLEGILTRASDELLALQDERKNVDPKTAEAIDEFVLKLKACAAGELPFTFILEDPAGNSYIENPYALSSDPALRIKFYERTPEQQALLGYLADPSQLGPNSVEETRPNQTYSPHGSDRAIAGQEKSYEIDNAVFGYSAPEGVLWFSDKCFACSGICETRARQIEIPYFKEAVVMVSSCKSCGYRDSELKAGGGIPKKGKKVSVRVENIRDLSRDLIRSDSASVIIPEIEFEHSSSTIGGVVTTVEGLIKKISDSLETIFRFGDSVEEDRKNIFVEFRSRLDKLLSLERPWTLILDDAMANSFIAPVCDDVEEDAQLFFEEYERTWEQNEVLGLNEMDTSSADDAYIQLSSNNADTAA